MMVGKAARKNTLPTVRSRSSSHFFFPGDRTKKTSGMAFMTNMYDDPWCRNKVDDAAALRHGHYYGWISHGEQANLCVQAGKFDEETSQFCLAHPLKIEGATLRVKERTTLACLPERVTIVNDVARLLATRDLTDASSPSAAENPRPRR